MNTKARVSARTRAANAARQAGKPYPLGREVAFLIPGEGIYRGTIRSRNVAKDEYTIELRSTRRVEVRGSQINTKRPD